MKHFLTGTLVVFVVYLVCDIYSTQRELKNIYALQTDRSLELLHKMNSVEKDLDKIRSRITDLEVKEPVSRSDLDAIINLSYTTNSDVYKLKQKIYGKKKGQ